MLSDWRPIGTQDRKVISMSTATLDHPVVTIPARRPSGPRGTRPGHLRVVRDHERRADGPVARAATAAAAPLRITRRGRLALTCSATLVVAFVIAGVLGLMGPAGATTSVVVQPGMTLGQIAGEQLPGVPLSQAITDIQRANKLNGSSIAAGQELVIPGR